MKKFKKSFLKSICVLFSTFCFFSFLLLSTFSTIAAKGFKQNDSLDDSLKETFKLLASVPTEIKRSILLKLMPDVKKYMLFSLIQRKEFSSKVIADYVGNYAYVMAINSPDNFFLALPSDNIIEIFDIKTCSKIMSIPVDKRVSSLAFSKDGRFLAVSFWNKEILIFDLKNKEVCFRINNEDDGIILSLCFSNNGKLLAAGSDKNRVSLFDISKMEKVKTFFGHTCWVSSLVFSLDDSKLVSGSYDCTLKVWDLSLQTKEKTLVGNYEAIRFLEFLDAEKVIAYAFDGSFKIFDIILGKELNDVKTCQVVKNKVLEDDLGDNLIVNSNYKSIKIYSLSTFQLLRTLPQNSWQGNTFFTSDCKRVISVVDNGLKIRVWEILTDEEYKALKNLTALHSNYWSYEQLLFLYILYNYKLFFKDCCKNINIASLEQELHKRGFTDLQLCKVLNDMSAEQKRIVFACFGVLF